MNISMISKSFESKNTVSSAQSKIIPKDTSGAEAAQLKHLVLDPKARVWMCAERRRTAP